MKSKIIKVQLISYSYDEPNNLVSWTLKDLSVNKEFVIAWDGDDLGSQFGIKGKMTPYLIKKFSQDLQGKVFNLDMQTPEYLQKQDWFKDEELLHEHYNYLETLPMERLNKLFKEQD